MNYIKLFEEFEYTENLKNKYAKKVAWVMQSNDIRSTSGDVNPREKKYNVAAKGNLFLNFSTKEDYDKDDIVVPNNVPILYYGGSKDEESAAFIKNKKIAVILTWLLREAQFFTAAETSSCFTRSAWSSVHR